MPLADRRYMSIPYYRDRRYLWSLVYRGNPASRIPISRFRWDNAWILPASDTTMTRAWNASCTSYVPITWEYAKSYCVRFSHLLVPFLLDDEHRLLDKWCMGIYGAEICRPTESCTITLSQSVDSAEIEEIRADNWMESCSTRRESATLKCCCIVQFYSTFNWSFVSSCMALITW